MGWALMRDAAAWISDSSSSRSSSNFSVPTTPEDKEQLTEMDKCLLRGRLPEDTGLDPAL